MTLDEAALAELERACEMAIRNGWSTVDASPEVVLALVAEVRRLRDRQRGYYTASWTPPAITVAVCMVCGKTGGHAGMQCPLTDVT